MGAYRCVVCSINFPSDIGVKVCPACDEDLSWRAKSEPHPDWRGMVAERVEAVCFEVTSETWWRAEMLMRIGLDIVHALSWAEVRAQDGGYEVDVHATIDRYKAMKAKGCSHETALLILAPDLVLSRSA